MALRAALNQFSTANPDVYGGAKVWVFEADPDGSKTDRLATLYDGPAGTGTLANPQFLDSNGQWTVIPYVDVAVIITAKALPFGEHDTGVIAPGGSFRGDWGPATSYQRGDTIRIGTAAAGGSIIQGNIWFCLEDHTSGASFQTDADAGKWSLYVRVGEASAAAQEAEDWARKTVGTVDGVEYSAKEHAVGVQAGAGGSAKAWATTTEDVTVPGGGGLYSSLHYAAKSAAAVGAAQGFANDASGYATQAEASASAASGFADDAAADALAADTARVAAEAAVGVLTPPIEVQYGGTGATVASAARDNLGLEIGVDVQAWDPALDYLSGSDPTTIGLGLLEATSPGAGQGVLSLVPGTNVQAYDADLQALAGVASAGILVRTGAGTAAARQIVAGSNVTVSGGDGVSGDVTIAAAGGSVDVQVFTASGTWTKPAGASVVLVEVVGGGGGGGGNNGGASGGGGGGYARHLFRASEFAATVSVTVGAQANGGSNADGAAGNFSSFGSHLRANGGGPGIAGNTAGGAGGVGMFEGGAGGTSAVSSVAGAGGSSKYGGGGGGSGTNNNTINGGDGGRGFYVNSDYANTMSGGGAAGTSGSGGTGNAGTSRSGYGAGDGGGGRSANSNPTAGAGGAPGGGGGGCGGSGATTRVGGAGARGEVRVMTW